MFPTNKIKISHLFLLLLTIADRNRSTFPPVGGDFDGRIQRLLRGICLFPSSNSYVDLIGFQMTNQIAELDQSDGRARLK